MSFGKFKRRIYHRPADLITDIFAILSHFRQIRPLLRGISISSDLRERLMLAVTAVNKCRYCSYVHARKALAEGISVEEIRALGDGVMEASPADELPALLYAQHWAEEDGKPDPTVRAKILLQYGQESAQAIELAMRIIRTANLLGNTFDYILYRFKFSS
jgi:AhpD family alkylhydroperoxidase